MFRRVLVANRGEIAVRVLRACQEMAIDTVAVYSEADAGALHVALAGAAACIGPPPPRDSYLRADRILEAAKAHGCDAIHPGYGFLSENAAFAQAVLDAGLTFIGPSPEAMRRLGSKTAARAVAQAAGVPVVPGFQSAGVGSSAADEAGSDEAGDEGSDEAALLAAAQQVGFPLLVKATAGGGGKGMRRVNHPEELGAALASARREALNAFGDARVYLERLIEAARHVEIQVLGDTCGNIVHLGERECSVQRRHQKIVEEAPSPLLDQTLREKMGAAAVAIARAAGYTNAGTMEFLVDKQRNFYFLESNTRLQVEHPVTETVTGLDLVKLQLCIAAGEPLPFAQADVTLRGHAIECRVYAEDAAAGFLPTTGRVLLAVEPVGPGVRVDAGVTTGDVVTLHYDPMIAKLIVQGVDRADAIGRMRWALRHYVLLGEVTTNIAFLQAVLAHPTFAAGEQTTDFCERAFAQWSPPAWPTANPPAAALIAAALFDASAAPARAYGSQADGRTADGNLQPGAAPVGTPWQSPSGFRLGEGGIGMSPILHLRPADSDEEAHAIEIDAAPEGAHEVTLAGRTYRVEARPLHGAAAVDCGALALNLDGRMELVHVARLGGRIWVHVAGAVWVLERVASTQAGAARRAAGSTAGSTASSSASGAAGGRLTAPMPGRVLDVLCAAGEAVQAGQTLVLLEAMKMELRLAATASGVVAAVHVAPGAIVARGDLLLEIAPAAPQV